MDSTLLRRYMVQAAKDERNTNADSFNLRYIKDSVGYRMAQNIYRLTAPLDEEGNPAIGQENMARFPSFLVRLDNLLGDYAVKDEDGNDGRDEPENEEEDDDPHNKDEDSNSQDEEDDDQNEDSDDSDEDTSSEDEDNDSDGEEGDSDLDKDQDDSDMEDD